MAVATATDLLTRECRTARRLGRLFRCERSGGFARFSAATIERLIGRRGVLIAELQRLDGERRVQAAPLSSELRQAVRELAGEVEPTLQDAEQRIERLRAELRVLGGAGSPTGLRGGGGGQVIGRG